MGALDFQRGIHGIGGVGKGAQHTITKVLHYPALMGFDNLADPAGQAGDRLGGFFISQGLEKPGAAGKIRENNSGVDCHCRSVRCVKLKNQCIGEMAA